MDDPMEWQSRQWGLHVELWHDPVEGGLSYRSSVWRPGGRLDVLSENQHYRWRDKWQLLRRDLPRDLDIVEIWSEHGTEAWRAA